MLYLLSILSITPIIAQSKAMSRDLVLSAIDNLNFDTLRELVPKLNVNYISISPITPVIMVEYLISIGMLIKYLPFQFSKHKVIDRQCLASVIRYTDLIYHHQLLKEILVNPLNTQLFIDYVDAGFELKTEYIDDVYSVMTDTRYDLMIARYFHQVKGVRVFLERASSGYDFRLFIDDGCYDKLIPKLRRRKMCMEGLAPCLQSLIQGKFRSYTIKEYNKRLTESLSFDQYLRMVTITVEYSPDISRIDIIQIFDTIDNKGSADIGGCINLIMILVNRFRVNSLNYPFNHPVILRSYKQIIELTSGSVTRMSQ